MAYGGGCIIGVPLWGTEKSAIKYIARDATIVGVSPNTLNGESTTYSANWTVNDGSWCPQQNATRTSSNSTPYAAIMASVGPTSANDRARWGLLCQYSLPAGMPAFNVFQNCGATSASSNFSTLTATKVQASTNLAATTTRIFTLDYPTSNSYVAMQAYGVVYNINRGALWGEACGVYFQEMQYNQELVTYRRTTTAPSAVEVKTLDGARRKVVTGLPATSISATFRWSDNGNRAKNLADILQRAVVAATPLMLYVPAGIYYTDAYLDLVVFDSQPTITMPAPGVYELVLEGTCQP